MVYFYTGTPGSGKSLHLAKTICDYLFAGKTVISNLDVNMYQVKALARKNGIPADKLGTFIFVPKFEFLHNSILLQPNRKKEFSYIRGLYCFAENFHKRDDYYNYIPGQTLLILDECDDYFLRLNYRNPDRPDWAEFFRMHRHYGFDCILCSQTDSKLDTNICGVLQTKVSHVDFFNYKGILKFLARLSGGHLFIVNESLYAIKGKDGHICTYLLRDYKKYYKIYNSFATESRFD